MTWLGNGYWLYVWLFKGVYVYLYVCVCVCVCVWLCDSTCVSVCACSCVHGCMCVWLYVFVCVWLLVHVAVVVCVCVYQLCPWTCLRLSELGLIQVIPPDSVWVHILPQAHQSPLTADSQQPHQHYVESFSVYYPSFPSIDRPCWAVYTKMHCTKWQTVCGAFFISGLWSVLHKGLWSLL